MANGRQHDAAGVYTGEYQRVDAVGAQQRLEAGAKKGLMRCLTTIGSPLSCGSGRMDCGAFAPGFTSERSVRGF
jgi:hypothetical protein